MKISDIIAELNTITPFELAESWDNVGLLLGDETQKVEHIIASLDLTLSIAIQAPRQTLFIVHHPLIFSPLKKIDLGSPLGKILEVLIEKKCAVIALHTNFDKTHLNRYVCEKILQWKIVKEEGFICYCDVENQTFDDIVTHVKTAFALEHPQCVHRSGAIHRIALSTGSGGSLLPYVQADLFLTGDIKYHDAMYAKERDLGLIDITHYKSEIFFAQIIADELKYKAINVTIRNSINPFGKDI